MSSSSGRAVSRIRFKQFLNRFLLLLTIAALLLFFVFVTESIAGTIVTIIGMLFAIAIELFPSLKVIHQQAWFESLWTTFVLVFLLILISGVEISHLRSPTGPEVKIKQFIISQNGSSIAIKPDENKPVTIISATTNVKVELSVGVAEQEKLMFTWYSCRRGDKPILQKIGDPEMLYVALEKTGPDCIVVEVMRGNMLLDRGRFLLNVQR